MSITESLPLAAARPARSGLRRRLAVAVAALLGAAVLFGGCGSDDGTPGSEAKQDGTTSAFPATIAQRLGDVTIEAEPKRVVALDFPSADNAIALGVVPVAMAEVSYVKGGVMTWTKAALGDRKTDPRWSRPSLPAGRTPEGRRTATSGQAGGGAKRRLEAVKQILTPEGGRSPASAPEERRPAGVAAALAELRSSTPTVARSPFQTTKLENTHTSASIHRMLVQDDSVLMQTGQRPTDVLLTEDVLGVGLANCRLSKRHRLNVPPRTATEVGARAND